MKSFEFCELVIITYHYSNQTLAHRLVRTIRLELGVTRELVELIVVDLGQLRTTKLVGRIAKSRGDLIDVAGNVGDQAGKKIRKFLDGELQAVAHKVVVLSQCLGIEDTIGQKLRVHADEAVGCAGVATDAAEFEVLEQHVIGVGVEEKNVVGVEGVTSVPVVWDTLVSRSVLEVTIVTGDSVEGF